MTDIVNVTPRRKLFCEGFKPRRDQTGESRLTLHRYGGPLFSDRQLRLKSDGPFRQAYGRVRGVLELKRCSIGGPPAIVLNLSAIIVTRGAGHGTRRPFVRCQCRRRLGESCLSGSLGHASYKDSCMAHLALGTALLLKEPELHVTS